MAKRLLLVRHARVAADHAGRFIGSTDLPLDDFGQSQCRGLAARVADLAPRRCYSSPRQRCTQTAEALAGGLAIALDDGLREIDFGRWEDCSFEQVRSSDPDLVERWATFAPDFVFPGGEGLAEFLSRVRAAADRLIDDPAETVLAVTHGGVIRAMICYLLGLDPRQYVLFQVGYAALAVIDLFDGQGVLAALEPAMVPPVAVPTEVLHG
jgi:alpha-ribazole phosphatase